MRVVEHACKLTGLVHNVETLKPSLKGISVQGPRPEYIPELEAPHMTGFRVHVSIRVLQPLRPAH